MKMVFTSQVQAEKLGDADPEWALISITSPNGAPKLGHWDHLLRLEFDDIDPKILPIGSNKPNIERTSFSADQAISILLFLLGLPVEVKFLVVHCWAGQSRSAGVIMALKELFGWECDQLAPNYNRHVYTTLLSTARSLK